MDVATYTCKFYSKYMHCIHCSNVTRVSQITGISTAFNSLPSQAKQISEVHITDPLEGESTGHRHYKGPVIRRALPWTSCQIRKIAGCACAGNAGNVSPRHRLQRKPLVSDPGMHHGTCVTHVPWCMSGSLTRSGGENVPGIPGACVTCNFTYLARSPWHDVIIFFFSKHPRFCRCVSCRCSRWPEHRHRRFHL